VDGNNNGNYFILVLQANFVKKTIRQSNKCKNESYMVLKTSLLACPKTPKNSITFPLTPETSKLSFVIVFAFYALAP